MVCTSVQPFVWFVVTVHLQTTSGLTSSSLLVFRLWVGYPFGEQILPQFQGRNDAEIVCSSLIE